MSAPAESLSPTIKALHAITSVALRMCYKQNYW